MSSDKGPPWSLDLDSVRNLGKGREGNDRLKETLRRGGQAYFVPRCNRCHGGSVSSSSHDIKVTVEDSVTDSAPIPKHRC